MAAITNERQYRVSRAQVRKLGRALEESQAHDAARAEPGLHQAMLDGLKSQINELKEEIAEYELLSSQKIRALSMDSLNELPLVLMKARIAQGFTQADLARIIDVKPQQIQRYEATDYQSVSFRRLLEVVNALGVEIEERVRLRDVTGL